MKKYKIQLPVLLSIAALHQLHLQIYLLQIFRTLFNLYISEKIIVSNFPLLRDSLCPDHPQPKST